MLNMKSDVRIGFGEYAQVADPNMDNTMKERTTGAISLLPLGNARGSVKFLSLTTGRVITRNQFTILPMSQEHIHLMNRWAEKSGTISGDLAISFDKYLSVEEEHEVDDHLPEMLLYRGVGDRTVNVDAPRVPLSEVPVPGATVADQSTETLVPTVVTFFFYLHATNYYT